MLKEIMNWKTILYTKSNLFQRFFNLLINVNNHKVIMKRLISKKIQNQKFIQKINFKIKLYQKLKMMDDKYYRSVKMIVKYILLIKRQT